MKLASPQPLREGSSTPLRIANELAASYAQVFFAHDRVAGALVAAATFSSPRVGLAGLLGALVAAALVRVLHLNDALAARGHYGYNALLAGLALGAFLARGSALGPVVALIVFAAAVSVFAQAALESSLGSLLHLPSLTLPYVIAALLALGVAPQLAGVSLAVDLHATATLLPGPLSLVLRSLGALFFVPTELGGALVLTALVAWSRVGALLAILGALVAQALLLVVSPAAIPPSLPLVLGYNGAATAIALGGVWFVPQRSSFLLGALAVTLTAALAFAATALLGPLGLPVLILPFNGTALIVLQAMRQRTRDGAPKSVDFAPGTPEANLNYYRTRLARFGARLGVTLRLPFYGRWTVTQGVDGPHTHRGEWRHALDFEGIDKDGNRHVASGAELKDYHCYRLPVFAAAAGTVVSVRNDVPDNPPGERNAREAWGNVVLIQHGPALYSLLAHLAPGSVEVSEGQFVTAGTRVGACGNSGRSFVPHLHFHLQTTPVVGAPTCELELSDVVRQSESGAVLHRAYVPALGDIVRSVEPRDEIAALFAWPLGETRTFEILDGDDAPARRETITAGIDLLNNAHLASDGGGHLYFERTPQQFVTYDHVGPEASVLRWMYAALPRVPFEAADALRWDDVLPARHFRARSLSWLLDFVDPFLSASGQRLEFRSCREGTALVIEGTGLRGSERIDTRARLEPGKGLCAIELRVGDHVRRARRIESGTATVQTATTSSTELARMEGGA